MQSNATRKKRLQELKLKYLTKPLQIPVVKSSPTPTPTPSTNLNINNPLPHTNNSPNQQKHANQNITEQPPLPPPQQHAVPWLIDPLVKNIMVGLPHTHDVLNRSFNNAADNVVWVCSLWDKRSRVSENVTSKGGATSIMFANVSSTIDTLRFQLRTLNTTQVLWQGSLPVPTRTNSRQIVVSLIGQKDNSSAAMTKTCNVTVSSFFKRWGSSTTMDTNDHMNVVWVFTNRDDRSGQTSILNERGVQQLLKSASDHQDPRMILNLLDKLIPKTTSRGMQRNCQLIAGALGAVWIRNRSHPHPEVAVIGSLTASLLNMMTTMLHARSSSDGSSPVNGYERARALLLIEDLVWSSVPMDMLLITMNTALQGILKYLQRGQRRLGELPFVLEDDDDDDDDDGDGNGGDNDDEKTNEEEDKEELVPIEDVVARVEIICILLAVGDSSKSHSERVAPLRRQWDEIAAKILPTLTACAAQLKNRNNRSNSNNQHSTSMAGVSLLRGMAAVLPPLLSRAPPLTVAAHLKMFLKSFPIGSCNAFAKASAVHLLSHVFEDAHGSTSKEESRFPISKALHQCAIAMLDPVVELLERVAQCTNSNSSNSNSSTDDDSMKDPTTWPSVTTLIGRAMGLMLKEGVELTLEVQSTALKLLTVSQDLLLSSLMSDKNSSNNHHRCCFCLSVLSSLRRLQSLPSAGSFSTKASTSAYSEGCNQLDAPRLVSLTCGLLHSMRLVISSSVVAASTLFSASFSFQSSHFNAVFQTHQHLSLVSNVFAVVEKVEQKHNQTRNYGAAPLNSRQMVGSIAEMHEHLLPSLRLASSSVVEDATFNSALLGLSVTMTTTLAHVVANTTALLSTASRYGATMSNDLRALSYWLRSLRRELHKPDTTWADPQNTSLSSSPVSSSSFSSSSSLNMSNMSNVTSKVLDAAFACCRAMSVDPSPSHRLSSSLMTLAHECVSCAMYSVETVSGQADRSKLSSVFAWFQKALETSAKNEGNNDDRNTRMMSHRRNVNGLCELRRIVAHVALKKSVAMGSITETATATIREVNDGAQGLEKTMKWTEVNVALLSFFSCVPTLSNVETDALTNTAQSPRYIDYNDGKHMNNSEEPQEHRLAEALSMMLVWWSHIEPALALPYADGLVKLHTATNNNHARVLSLVAKARLTGALATQGLLPWRVYASNAIRAATAVRTAQVNDSTALELCRHAHRHPRAVHSLTKDQSLHESLRILSESILNGLQICHVDSTTHYETSSCWFAVRTTGGKQTDVWHVYRHESWISMDDFLGEMRQAYPSHRILSPSHPIPPVGNQSTSYGLKTLLPSSKELQVFVCHPVVEEERDDIAGASVDVDDVEDSDDVLRKGKYVVHGFADDKHKQHRSYHKPLKGKVFGTDPETWHLADQEIVGQCVQIFLEVDQGPVLRGLSRRQKVSVVKQNQLTATEACTEWIERMNHRVHSFIQMLESGERNENNGQYLVVQPSQEVEKRLSAVHSELGKILSSKDSPAANLQNALKIIVYYREWEMKYQREQKTALKKTWIRAKREAKKNGAAPPPEPNYTLSTSKNVCIEKMVVVFTQLVRHVEDAIDLCEEMYDVDMQKVRSLISAMYGSHVEAGGEVEE